MELWKDIKGYEGKYQVSNIGRVRNTSGKVLTQKTQNRGYRHVLLSNGKGKFKSKLVHRLVADAFVPNPNGFPIVNHIDENKKNNCSNNLEWCTQSENMRRHFAIHECDNLSWGRTVANRERVEQINNDGSIVKVWEHIAQIHREVGYNATSIKECCIGKRKTAYGYKWRYASSNITTLEKA